MKILTCPINGPRPIQEFHYGGEVREMPDPGAVKDDHWAGYIFHRDGEPSVKKEWWYHIASGVWFVAERDNVTDEILCTYLWGQESDA